MLPEKSATASYQAYAPGPELMPFNAVARQDLPVQQATPSEFGAPVVALMPSQTMQWHLAAASNAPLDPGPVDATPPVTSVIDPASIPTPVSQFAAVSYQSMASPSYVPLLQANAYASAPAEVPYASAPAQGDLAAPIASPYGTPMAAPHAATAPVLDEVEAIGVKALTVAGIIQRVIALVLVGAIVAVFTTVGSKLGGTNALYIVGFAWLVGISMVIGIFVPGRLRLRWSGLK
jgi:hypothetical protein